MDKRLTRAQAIHAFCIDCMGGQVMWVKECTTTKCPLWRYRTGGEEGEDRVTRSKKSS